MKVCLLIALMLVIILVADVGSAHLGRLIKSSMLRPNAPV